MPHVRSVAEAAGDSRDGGSRVICAAPQHALFSTPRTARVIARRIPIIVLSEPVLAPLQDVAGHVMQAETIRRKRTDRRGVCVAVVVAVEQVKVGVVVARLLEAGVRQIRHAVFGKRVAPHKQRTRLAAQSGLAAARRVFPLGFIRQPPPGPRAVVLGVFPSDVNDRMRIGPAPRGRGGHRTPGGVAELAILRDGDVVPMHPKPGDAHAMRRLLALRELLLISFPIELLPDAVNLIWIAAHQELARRNEHHLRAVYGVGARSGILARGRGGGDRRRLDLRFTLTSSQADQQAETDPATATASRHGGFSKGNRSRRTPQISRRGKRSAAFALLGNLQEVQSPQASLPFNTSVIRAN